MRRLLVALLLLASVAPAAAQDDDPLACLDDRGDGAVTWIVGADGRWHFAGASDVPALQGEHGAWYGYSETAGWSYSFGWPDDYEAYQTTTLYREDREVGYLWYYRFPSRPDLTVLFVYRSMATWTDSAGRHDGEHDFCWWGELSE